MDEDTQPTVTEPRGPLSKKKPARWLVWLRRLVFAILAGIVFGVLAITIGIIVVSQDLPNIKSLDDYRPAQATEVYGRGGNVVARFAKERRTVVDYDKIPQVMIDAVISAEDAAFFEHAGIDYVGIVRCAFKNAVRGRAVCGASTITQQTVKTFFLTYEKRLTRKVKELVLAKRIEEALSKEDILYLYLNQIYFGHGAYGVEAASRVYFGKSVSDIDVAEAALLAGLPQSPSRLDPYRHSQKALNRRAYVLEKMYEQNKITAEVYEQAKEAPLELDWNSSETAIDSNTHYAAHVKTILKSLEEVGEERLDAGGLKVYTGIDPKLQRVAEDALREGLRALDKRQGWRGAILNIEADALREARELLEKRRKAASKRKRSAPPPPADDEDAQAGPEEEPPIIWDLSRLDGVKGSKSPSEITEAARLPKFELGETYAGFVVVVDDHRKEARVDLGGVQVVLPMRTALRWAHPFQEYEWEKRPTEPSQVLKVGDIVLVRTTQPYKTKKGESTSLVPTYYGKLEQTPLVEGALVSIDPQTREVRALVGGYGIGAGTFNRAVQARRQPGSTFKPFVYSAAFDTENFTPVSKCLDQPRVYRDRWTGNTWKPQNYGGRFSGDITLRTALTLSKNICSVELIDKVGVDPVRDMAKRAGITSALPGNLTLALGSGDVSPLEMVNAYATLASQGQLSPPIFVRKVVGLDGEILYEQKYKPKQTIRPEITYITTSLMQSVVEDGTARRVKQLGRPVAGKTGTTNESRDAWFIGFTPDLVAGVWVGFDNNATLGVYETGGRAAIPIWLEYMTAAVEGSPANDFVAPANVVFAFVDPKTGKLATPDTPGALNEPFIMGTEPQKSTPVDDIDPDKPFEDFR